MSAGRVHWRDSLMTWPCLSVTLVLLPWQWSLRFWNDWDMTASWSLWLGPLRVEWFANKPMFTLERVEPALPAPVEQRFACWDGACPIKTTHWKREPGCIRLSEPSCSTCGGAMTDPPCCRNPETGKGGHTVAGGCGAGGAS